MKPCNIFKNNAQHYVKQQEIAQNHKVAEQKCKFTKRPCKFAQNVHLHNKSI